MSATRTAGAPGQEARDPGRVALAALLGAALALRFALAQLLPNVHWPDEIYQSLEQAHRVVFGYGIVPWEFRLGTRSWLLPGFLAGVFRATSWVSGSAWAYLAAAQLVLCALSLVPVAVAYAWARERHGWRIAVVAGWACAVWFELVFFAAKALSEVVAAHLLVTALWLLGDGAGEPRRRRLAGAGALLALVVSLRLQLAPAALVVAALACRASVRRRWTWLVTGALPVAAAIAALDAATWSYPFQPLWLSFRVNVLEGRSRRYGILSWSAYGAMLQNVWSWGAFLLLGAAAVGARRRPALAAAAVVVLVTHSAIPHKEYRFVYPAVVLVVLAASLGTAEILAAARRSGRWSATAAALATASAWLALSTALGVRFGGRDAMQLDGGQGSEWTRSRTALEAFASLRDDPALCGVGLYGVSWAFSGGYTYLHRNVPIFLLSTRADYARLEAAFDAALVYPDPGLRLSARGGRVVRCWPDGGCLVRRDGPCERVPGYHVNRQLEAWDQ